MSTDAYLPLFLAEAREHLRELELAVMRLEQEPGDRPTVDAVFRAAHSLKGMSATMGFAGMAALTHALEDAFELLRQREDGLPREAVDVLLACLDALERAVESITADGEERLDPAPLAERVRQLVRGRTPEQELANAGGAALPDLSRMPSDGRRLLHVVADLDPGAPMPGVRAFMLFEALAAHGELAGSIPALDGVERFAGRHVEAWLASRTDEAGIEAAAMAVGDVARVAVRPADPVPAPSNDAPAPPQRATATVRVDAARLDELMHLMGELVIHRTAVETHAAEVADPALQRALGDLARSSQLLQAAVTHVRMVPVETVFLRFPRLVRDLAGRLEKQVELRLHGAETELDRTVVDALGDPLVHLVRNALDHGLETPSERAAAGKPPTGTVALSARHAGGHVIVSVRDDGRGIDPGAIGRAAHARGLIGDDDILGLDVATASELLFTPGFSTAATTSDVSGRGVGMDAVRAAVRALGGDVTLEPAPDAGTVASIRLPLTLAIVTALLVGADGLPYALPLDRVERMLRLADHGVRTVGGARMLVLDDEELLPLLDAGAVLGHGPSAEAHRYAVVVRAGERRIALSVADLIGRRELVTRPLPREARGRAAVARGAVLPNGRIALIADCDALVALAPGGAAQTHPAAPPPVGARS